MPVYFVQAGEAGAVKIGWAKVVTARIRAIQPFCPAPLRLLRETPGDKFVEAWFHRQFASRRIAHEWFTFDPRMLDLEPPAALLSDDRDTRYRFFHPRTRRRWPQAEPTEPRAA